MERRLSLDSGIIVTLQKVGEKAEIRLKMFSKRKVRESMLIRNLTPYGKDVKCQLVELGLTQVELAKKIGTSKQYLGKIIYGERAGTMYLNQID